MQDSSWQYRYDLIPIHMNSWYVYTSELLYSIGKNDLILNYVSRYII